MDIENREHRATKVWKVDGTVDKDHPFIHEAGEWLRNGGTVAFPTETVYGLGADARNTAAVKAIFDAKGRPSDNPLIVHIANRSQAEELITRPSEAALRVMDALWPGPLALVLPVRGGAVSPLVTAGLDTIALRVPDHPIALRLIEAAGCPIAAPSGNRSGRPSPTCAAHVREDLFGRIDGLLDGGSCGIGVESTVIELRDGCVYILRPGGTTMEQIQAVIDWPIIDAYPSDVARNEFSDPWGHYAAEQSDTGSGNSRATDRSDTGNGTSRAAEQSDTGSGNSRVAEQSDTGNGTTFVHSSERPRSPGVKYTHYAPKGQVIVVQGAEPVQRHAWMQARVDAAQAAGERTAVLTFEEYTGHFQADCIIPIGQANDPTTTAVVLFDALRQCDSLGATFILAEACLDEGVGHAVLNRLRKAAGHQVVQL